MREWVAHNKTVPLSILEALADDSDERVRMFVAMKGKLTLELFQKLSTDPSETVRTRLVYNRKVPTPILEKMVNDPSSVVAEVACSRLGLSELKIMFQTAFISPIASHCWASARAKSHWRDLELLQDKMAGPLWSVAKTGGCEYEYTRNDQYFAGVDSPATLSLRLTQWHADFALRIEQFVPASAVESVDHHFMRSVVEMMLKVIERAVALESRRWESRGPCR